MVDVDDHDETVTRLLSACEHGDSTTLHTLIEQDLAAVDACDGEESSLLQVAAANGHETLVRYLIMRGAKIDMLNSYGWTALMQSARAGHHKVVTLLLQNKVDVNVKNKLGSSALTVAARGGHTQVVRMLLEVPGIELSDNTHTVTPLMIAAQYGHDTVVRLLLDRGARVNHQDEHTGWNALMATALNGHMTTAQILVDRGCDPNVTSLSERTALSIAIQSGKRSREVRGYLDRKTTNKPKLEPEDTKPDILEAAKTGNIKRIREILHDDVKAADTIGEDGGTPLMFAAMSGQLVIVDLLVHYGADVNRQDTASGWTALMQATYYGKKEVAKYLITQGANVNIQAKDGCTAFDLAVLIDDTDTELVRQLASVAMKVNKPQHGKSTSMPWASKSKSSENINSDGDAPKSGLKAWWSRMSNRFRNLKLTSTFRARFSSNRLQPFHGDDSSNDSTLKRTSDDKHDHKPKSSTSIINLDEIDRKLNSPKKSASVDSGLDNSQTSKALYTLSLASPTSKLPNDKLMPVIPPFLPPPSFDLSSSDKPKMQSMSSKMSSPDSKGGVNRRIMQSAKFASPRSPSDSANYGYDSSSPNSSAGADGVGRVFTASHRSHPMYRRHTYDPSVNRPRPVSYPTMAFISGPSEIDISPIQHKYHSPNRGNTHMRLNSSNSSTTSSSLTPSRPLNHFSGTSQSSTSPTLTPSASPDPRGHHGSTISSSSFSSSSHKQKNTSSSSGISEDDELSQLMKKLSLEKYTPIFEEQEVDMEAFLTLTDEDLQELGISHNEPRRQILSAISELNSGKGREREFLRTTLTKYHASEFPDL